MIPTVSIVIPHFDRSELLGAAVSSVFESGYHDVEVVIVDDGSVADEWERVQRLEGERVRVLRRESGPKGPSRCRNLGVLASRAEFVVFLDSDDVLAPWCLHQRMHEAMNDSTADCWVFPVMLFNNTPGDRNALWNRLSDNDDAMRFVRSDPPWHTSSTLWRKSTFTALDGFDEQLIYGDDSDLHLRALLGGVVFRKFPNALPDVFVRRSAARRITNSLDDALLESRLQRLSSGSRFLASSPSYQRYLEAWKGQYFMEGEFLLFNVDSPLPALKKLLIHWKRELPPSPATILVAEAYFGVATRTRDTAYLLLRIARKAAMAILPRDFFPQAGAFENEPISEESMNGIRSRLQST